jgi:hypothetical protein
MIQINRNSQTRDSNPNLRMGNLDSPNHHTDNPNLRMGNLDNPNHHTNNNGGSNLNHRTDSLSSLRMNNNGESNHLRIMLRHSM